MDDVQFFQMIVVLALATVVFFSAYSLPQKVAATILIIIIPIQPIETQYASANTVLTWVVFTAMLMRGDRIKLAMLPQILILLFIYLLSMGMQDPSTYSQHGIFIFNLITAFLVLWITYDLCQRYDNINKVVRVFIAMNVLVAIYSLIQMTAEPFEKYTFFGIEEMNMLPIIKRNRLSGPFGGPGIVAEYLVIMTFVAIHQILSADSSKYRLFLYVLVGVNLLLLIATGNRGGFLTLIGSATIFLWMFRNVLGVVRTIRIAIGGVAILSISAAVAVNFTKFDVLFTRLAETEIDAGVPDTRQKVWPVAWQEIQARPILGHGPRLRFVDDETGMYSDVHTYIFFPHNLYLFLLFTVGIIGTIAFLVFLGTPMVRCWLVSRQMSLDQDTRNLARIGFIIMIVVFVDQMKVEFMRLALTDYWHFLFGLIGLLIAACDQARAAPDDRYASSP